MSLERTAASRGHASLYWLALGTFAIGTESFMIAAILPQIAADLSVTVAAAGQLMGIFAISYAVSSPILTAATGKVDRRKLLLLSMAAFAVGNVIAATTRSYAALAVVRVLLACAAGIYTPNANALASVLVAPQHRARAIAVVNGGLTVAIAIGVPLGAVVGNHLGWRLTFAGVAGLAAIAVAGLAAGLPAGVGSGMVTASLAERLRVVRMPRVVPTLLVTTSWAVGTYTVYSFVAPFLTSATPLRGAQVGYALFLWGASAGIGLFVGGSVADKRRPRPVIGAAIGTLAFALATLSVCAHWIPVSAALVPVLAAIALWGVSAWAFFPAQQEQLIETVGVKLAPLALSLNASFMYLGFSLGSALGAVALVRFGVANLGWAGSACELAALVLFFVIGRRAVASVTSSRPPAASSGDVSRG
jgi:predicted MFS family arabinose efflux permease